MTLEPDDMALIYGVTGIDPDAVEHVRVTPMKLPQDAHTRDWMGNVHCAICKQELTRGLVLTLFAKLGGYWPVLVCKDREACKLRGACTSQEG